MARILKIIAWALGTLIVLPIAVIAVLVLVGNMDSGRRLLEATIARVSGGDVVVAGLSGHFPDDLHVSHAEARDEQGLWMTAENVTLQWSPWRLLHRDVEIHLLRAGRVQLMHLPSRDNKNEPFKLRGRIDVDRLDLDHVDIGAPIAGIAAVVNIQGDAHIVSLQNAVAALSVSRIDAPGTYKLNGRIDASALNAQLVAEEPAHGLLSGLARLPELGALSAQITMQGRRDAEALHLALTAGPLRASGHGLVDLIGETVNMDLSATAPAMAPRQDLRWRALSLQAHVHGPFTRPDATAQVHVDDVKAGEGELRSLRADLHGSGGLVTLHAMLDRLRLPGSKPDLLQSAPVELSADVRLDDPVRPVTFAVSHPLISVRGHANTGGALSAALTLVASELEPFGAMAGIDVKGRTAIDARVATADQVTQVDINGTLALTRGKMAELIGESGKIDVSASMKGQEINLKRAQIVGRTLRMSAEGTSQRDTLDLNWKMALSNIAQLMPGVSGPLQAQGRVQGRRDNLDLTADATGDLGTQAFPHGPVVASVRLRGLPGQPTGNIEAHGTLDGSALRMAVTLDRGGDGAWRGKIQNADWKSAHAEGDVELRTGDRLPQGRMAFRIAQLNDLRLWLGNGVQGSAAATVDLVQAGGHAQAKIQLDARNVAMAGNRADHIAITGRIDDPTTHPSAALQIAADRIAAGGAIASARADANGPLDALNLKVSSDIRKEGDEGDARLSVTALLNSPGKEALVSALQVQYRGETVQLLAPVRVSFRDGLAVERLRVGAQGAVLELAGRISPALNVTASLRNATLALAKAFMPDLQADGTLTMDARLNGSIAQPRGTIGLRATGLHMRTGSARTLPPANVVATVELNGPVAHVDANLDAGRRMRVNAKGQVPLVADGSMDVRANGTIDAAIANAMLEVNGRRVKGEITMDIGIRGPVASPRMNGSLRLADGDIQDYVLGAHLSKVEAQMEAAGDQLRITHLTAQAGSGTVSASGSVGIFVPGRPVDMKVTARNAQVLASDLLTTNMDLDLTLRGQLQTRLDADGTVKINRGIINIPNALPPTVAVLDVRRPGQKPPPSPSPTRVIGLNLAVDAPRAVFVRGRGLDAEVGGALHVRGTTASPQISGGLDMRRGTFDLAGATLKFTSGRVSFNGTGLTQKIDPTLDFEAETTSNNITATLTVSGYADAPKITLTSTPELPQDEVLARLLFGVSVKQLTVLQIAQMGTALATLGGVGGRGANPLLALQRSLGLDRLAVGGASASTASVEAGRYISPRVYLGAKQAVSGGTQAQVEVDLTKHLKLQATLGTGGTVQGATPYNDPGSSVGLSYQFEY
jgi:translocation and assembly module TamB